ncbi:MAG: lipoprotein-releasing system permease protein, partial [Verrucomicrobiales bacterium]|nr:lipoprotein-releasing system permease protein [Verrucomicrobiales bacterium]
MSLLPYEAFLALRYLRPRRTFVSVITVISVIGVMLGVAVLIIVIAVMSGFDQEWRTKILGFNAHIKVTGQHGILTNYSEVMAQVASNKWVVGVAPFVQGAVLVDAQGENNQSRARPGFLRGIDPELETKVSVLPNSVLRGGSFNVTGNNILVGVAFANGMNLSVGDRIQIYSPGSYAKIKAQLKKKGNGGPDIAVLPDEFTIAGIFDVGFEEYNENIIVTSLERAQELYSLNDESVHGLQVMVTDPYKSNAARASLRGTLGLNNDMVTWQEATPVLFNALATEKNMMFFLVFFIIIVAAFGIV